MRPDLSEFSYGYALTENLIQWVGTSLTAAPVFPSLLKKGNPEVAGMSNFRFRASPCVCSSNSRTT